MLKIVGMLMELSSLDKDWLFEIICLTVTSPSKAAANRDGNVTRRAFNKLKKMNSKLPTIFKLCYFLTLIFT